MTPAELEQAFRSRLGDSVVEAVVEGIHPFVKVKAEAWFDAARIARDELGCETLHDLTASDGESTMTVLLHLWSYSHRHWVNLKADVDRADPRIASLQPLWNAADWHERECWDMLGVRFEGHPNLRRILCPEDWEGFPLRKDYKMPDYYHGIPGIPVLLKRQQEQGRCFPPQTSKQKGGRVPTLKTADEMTGKERASIERLEAELAEAEEDAK